MLKGQTNLSFATHDQKEGSPKQRKEQLKKLHRLGVIEVGTREVEGYWLPYEAAKFGDITKKIWKRGGTISSLERRGTQTE